MAVNILQKFYKWCGCLVRLRGAPVLLSPQRSIPCARRTKSECWWWYIPELNEKIKTYKSLYIIPSIQILTPALPLRLLSDWRGPQHKPRPHDAAAPGVYFAHHAGSASQSASFGQHAIGYKVGPKRYEHCRNPFLKPLHKGPAWNG